MSEPEPRTVEIRATGSGPLFLALLEAAARIEGAEINCGYPQTRSMEEIQAELDAKWGLLAQRRAERSRMGRIQVEIDAEDAFYKGKEAQAVEPDPSAEQAKWDRELVKDRLAGDGVRPRERDEA